MKRKHIAAIAAMIFSRLSPIFFVMTVLAFERATIQWWEPTKDPAVIRYNVYALTTNELTGTNKWWPVWFVSTNDVIPYVTMEEIMPLRTHPRGFYKIVIRSVLTNGVEGGDVNLTNDYYHYWDYEVPETPTITVSP